MVWMLLAEVIEPLTIVQNHVVATGPVAVLPVELGQRVAGVGVMVGGAGFAFTTTVVVPAAEVQPLTVTVTEYVPASAVVALARVGFWSAEVKPFGPVHEYVAPATSAVESEIVEPTQYGPPLLAVGVAGMAL